jgi:hypothetical protein
MQYTYPDKYKIQPNKTCALSIEDTGFEARFCEK